MSSVEEVKEEVKEEATPIQEVKVVVEEPKIVFNPKKIETSKVLLILVLTVCFVFTILIVLGWFLGLSEAPAMLGIIASPAISIIAAYIWKSKKENEIKLQAIYGKLYRPDQDQYGFGSYNQYGNYKDTSPYDNSNGMG